MHLGTRSNFPCSERPQISACIVYGSSANPYKYTLAVPVKVPISTCLVLAIFCQCMSLQWNLFDALCMMQQRKAVILVVPVGVHAGTTEGTFLSIFK